MPTNVQIVDSVIDRTLRALIGWPGANGRSLRAVGGLVAEICGDGDHVEIGSLFGASALVAYRTKVELKRNGNIYCIDPMIFDEHEYCVRIDGNDSRKLLLENQHQIFCDNTRTCDGIKLIRKRSNPWPLPGDQRFATAFIDGWHYGDGPLNDAKTLVEIVDNAILLDDAIPNYPDVYRAFLYLCSHPNWFLQDKLDRCALFIRRKGTIKTFTTEGGKHTHATERED